MEKRAEQLGYHVAFNPPRDGDCFYASAAKALSIETQGLRFYAQGEKVLKSRTGKYIFVKGLIAVFDALLTGKQNGQKLQCLYGNPMANNFFQNWIFRNLWIRTLKY